MRVYIAGRYSRRDEFRKVADVLRARGTVVTSRWLEETAALDGIITKIEPDKLAAIAHVDMDDIDAADAVLFFAEDPLVGTPRGGRHVEFGYALARGKFINVIGPRENVFHYSGGMIEHFTSFEDYLAKWTTEVTF